MRFVKMSLTNFRGIEAAIIDFGPGLNIVFGPNDLGKSTVAEAIRAVLLLPITSTEAQHYVPWHRGVTPIVELTFVDDEGRGWRVTKAFGTGASGESTLAYSKDGVSFSVDSRGREVDQRLREQLKWGVASPGGGAGARGMPRSFLANALLSEQTEVGEILQSSLAHDSHESGKLRIKSALSALAEDPRVRKVLNAAQKERDRYFTATGRQKGGSNSPFRPLQSELKARREEKEALETQWHEAKTAHGELAALEERMQAAAEERDRLHEELTRRQALLVQTRAHAQARAALERSEQALAEIDALKRSVSELEMAVSTAEQTLPGAQDRAALGTQEVEAARSEKDRAEQLLRGVESEAGNSETMIEKARAEQRASEIERDVERLEARLTRAREGQEVVSALRRARESQNELEHLFSQAVDQQQKSQAAVTVATEDIERLRKWRVFSEIDGLTEELKRKTEAREAAAKLDAETARMAAHIDETAAALEANNAPTRDVLKTVSALDHQRALLRSQTAAGLEVSLEVLAALQVSTSCDANAQAEYHSGPKSFTIEADREVSIAIPDVANIKVATGTSEQRAELGHVEARWATEGAPVLARAGASTLQGLESAVERREHLERTLADAKRDQKQRADDSQRLRTTAEGIEGTSAKLDDMMTTVSMVDREELAAELRESHPGVAPASLDETSLRNSVRALEREEQTLRDRMIALQEKAQQARVAVGELEARLTGVAGAIGATIEDELQAVGELMSAQIKERETNRRHIEELELVAQQVSATAAAKVREATARFDDAQEAAQTATRSYEAAFGAYKELQGTVRTQREHLERKDRPAAEAALVEATTGLEAAPAPGEPIDDATVEAARVALEAQEQVVTQLHLERENQRGALTKTGGNVVRERLEDARQAVERAEDDLKAAELDAEAAKLLLETLTEAQQSSSNHVGVRLSKPVEERFHQLTNGRYGRLLMTPDLSTEHVDVAGTARGPEDLSVGTREQLATILRLVVAEQLGAPIILDDHLVQSDPGRLDWFSSALRNASAKTQVIIMTCRRDDYLAESEWPVPGEAYLDHAGGTLRAINLEVLVRRWQPERGRGDAALPELACESV